MIVWTLQRPWAWDVLIYAEMSVSRFGWLWRVEIREPESLVVDVVMSGLLGLQAWQERKAASK